MSQDVLSNEASQRDADDPSPPFIFTQILPATLNDPLRIIDGVTRFTLALTADERTKSRHYFKAQLRPSLDLVYAVSDDQNSEIPQTCGIYLRLPRGTVLKQDDMLTTEQGNATLQIVAKPEAVMTAIAPAPLDLLKAAYHLGNRHVTLEVTLNYLRFAPDPVLKTMVEHIGLTVTDDFLPFHPETGAYGSHRSLSPHSHSYHSYSHHSYSHYSH